jgi:hypothetical protein
MQNKEMNFDTNKLMRLLDHDNHETRQKFRELMKDPIFIPRYDVSLRFERELAFERLKRICDAGLVSVLDFQKNPLRVFASQEMAGKNRKERKKKKKKYTHSSSDLSMGGKKKRYD